MPLNRNSWAYDVYNWPDMKITMKTLCLLATLAPFAQAENWPQWRGPFLNGSTTETNLPEDLSNTQKWAVKLPGHGNSTPVVFGERIFVSSIDNKSKELVGQCFSLADGKCLWKQVSGIGAQKNGQNDLSSPSPITDGKKVIFYYGTGDLAAFDLEGKPLWSRGISKDHGAFNMLWLYGSTGLLYKDKLYIPVLHRDVSVGNWNGAKGGEKTAPSYLLAIDPETGKDLWKQIRPTDAKAESHESYATPIPREGKDRTEIMVIGGDCVTAHDPQTGAELWRCGGWNPQKVTHWRLVPSVCIAGDLVIATSPKNSGYAFAIRPGGSGDVTATHIAWQNKLVTSDTCSALYYQSNLYILDGDFKKGLNCLDPATGERKWFQPIDSKSVLRTSPTGADGKIYVMNEAGDVWVLSATEPKILSKIALGSDGQARGSVVAAQGRILVRTGAKLYCYGK